MKITLVTAPPAELERTVERLEQQLAGLAAVVEQLRGAHGELHRAGQLREYAIQGLQERQTALHASLARAGVFSGRGRVRKAQREEEEREGIVRLPRPTRRRSVAKERQPDAHPGS